MANHYHDVQRPGKPYSRLPCYFGGYTCPYAKATAEELGVFLESGERSIPFLRWLDLYRKSKASQAEESGTVVHPSVSQAVRESIENPKTTRTVPVTIEKSDGSRWVVGEAEVGTKDGSFFASMKLNPDSIAAHMSIAIPFNADLGPFLVSTEGCPTPPSQIVQCNSMACQYPANHKHGSACTAQCICNRQGRVD